MLFRIDDRHFLTHMVDYVTREEMLNTLFVVISGGMRNNARINNVAACVDLYPTTEMVAHYHDSHSMKELEAEYRDLLFKGYSREETGFEYRGTYGENVLYNTIIRNVLNHSNLVMICKPEENDYLEVLSKIIEKEYAIPTIDLNKLFSEGHIGPIYIDFNEVHDRCVKITRDAMKNYEANIASTRDGKEYLISKMTKSEKIRKLKELGIKHISTEERRNLNTFLLEAWCDEDDTPEE